ncbi:hypothetical protein F2Q68_00027261 [Brassica cretica]|uniref:Uncharacterized protein n=1 Tax=Brassica cretica TaxID=69181 RepID=A0A8S9I651_BRACR|nr:hypothetical protein F2Q68_00027261 [Brassica cretica]
MLLQVSNIFIQQFQKASRTSGGLNGFKKMKERWLNEFGEIYSKNVVVLAVAIALLGPILFKWPFLAIAACREPVYSALELMVTASQCALAVAYAPTAISFCARKASYKYTM